MLPYFQALARGASDAARAALWRGEVAAAIWVTALVGSGFLVFAAYAAMRPALGPAFSALLTGGALICAAVVAAEASGQLALLRKPEPKAAPQQALPTGPVGEQPKAAEATAMAVFTAAYVLGRRLADRQRE
jgi:hypothetical protein